MDSMLEHPGTELQVLIKEKGLTQKAFASILGKKISEVNELLKGKRNITIQRDYLLHQALGTPIKYWITKQIDYEYSILNLEELENKPNLDKISSEKILEEEKTASDGDGENSKEKKNTQTINSPSEIENLQNRQNVDNENGEKNNANDIKKRAEIFRSF